ncbi:MAG: hypothetical protein O7I93_00145 [Gemmatimonadetes bacterium]|nr:hypothetical protein [Gemmatimonadota bacterium]
MRTIDHGPSGGGAAWSRVLRRIRLLRRLGWMTVDYFLVGGRVRRAYRERVRRGETLYLDRWPRLPDPKPSKPGSAGEAT